MEFLLQPNVYSTGKCTNLLNMLDNMWIKDHKVGDGTLYILSGFANYNGGVRFYPYFSNHTRSGGKIKAIFGGSMSQRLSSIQVVESMLECGADVYVVNRKRLVHAKCYGYETTANEELVVTSGNFTGPGMSQNAEAAMRIETESVKKMGFSWVDCFDSILKKQKWDIYEMPFNDLKRKANPGWRLLYDEIHDTVKLDESQEMTMVVLLGGSDTARIQATPGSEAGKGTQYFWLSKGSFDFFPALTEKNRRGIKNTYSCIININYIDIGLTKPSRVTFEADNNLDFRLGTGELKYTRVADVEDLALITRLSEYDYELRIVKKSSPNYNKLKLYATSFIGNRGKQYGYISNTELLEMLSIK